MSVPIVFGADAQGNVVVGSEVDPTVAESLRSIRMSPDVASQLLEQLLLAIRTAERVCKGLNLPLEYRSFRR
jgi:hypothetical protein